VGAFGADWFYLANGRANYIVAGCFKLITGAFFIIGSCFLCCTTLCSFFDRSKLQAFGVVFSVIIGVLMVICSLTNAIWYTVDWIRILCNAFPDGNGVALKNW